MRVRVRFALLSAVAALWVVAGVAGPASAAPGDLDPSFGGGDGQVSTTYPAGGAYGYATMIQPDGKVVVAGDAFHTTDDVEWALARYKPNGQLDPTFGDGGKVETNLTGGFDGVYAVRRGPHGTIYAAGESASAFAVARYLPDGHLDHTFSGDGKAFVTFALGNAYGYGMAIAPGGKVVVVGEVDAPGGIGRFGVARLTGSGAPDHSFSGDGKLTSDLGDNSYAWEVIAFKDGSILAVGDANTTSNTSPGLVKYTVDGTPDPNFGSGGVEVDDVGVDVSPSGLVKLSNGKLLVVGPSRTSPNTFELGLVRFQSNGHPDETFGPNGFLTRDYGGTSDYPERAVLSGKRVLVAMAHDDGTGEHLALVRLLPNGAADTEFGDGGIALATVDHTFADALAVDASGRVVVSGSVGTSDVTSRFFVARFLKT